jgi:DNA invertase Pin-like site-specific DNA recombinase
MCRRAYGYIRSACDDMREIERLRREMHLHARRRGLMLIEVFTDKGVASTALARQGFSALLDSLKAMARLSSLCPRFHICHASPRCEQS